ncbi:MAG: hypothetical protein NC548_26160 [Lachnospiraceae bacterium]|nr:hypothetical protein [Lachnospiraceae bacterium]
MNILITLFYFIIFIFVLHFVGLPLSKWLRTKSKKKYENNILNSKRFRLYATSDKSLMLCYTHDTSYWRDDEDAKYAKSIGLTFGGFNFSFYWSKDFLPDDKYDNDICKFYGFHTINNEKFWNCFWWGNKLYDNPFKNTYFLGCWLFDPNTCNLINQKGMEYKDYPLIHVSSNTSYTCKDGDKHDVNKITWWIEERIWIAPILHWLHIDYLFPSVKVSLSFDSNTELGVKRGSWKGGVMGSDINLTNEPDLYNTYMNITRKGHAHLITKFKHDISQRIKYFLTQEKRY